MLKTIEIFTVCLLLSTTQVYAHGYLDAPGSRSFFCSTASGLNKHCGAIQYEPQSIEGPQSGFDSGGLDQYLGSVKIP